MYRILLTESYYHERLESVHYFEKSNGKATHRCQMRVLFAEWFQCHDSSVAYQVICRPGQVAELQTTPAKLLK